MLFQVSAVFLNTGVSKNTGQPFTMSRITVQSAFRDVDSPNFQSHGFGFSSVDLAVNTAIFNDLQKHFVAQLGKLGKSVAVEMDLMTSMDGDGRTIITGFNSAYVADSVMNETVIESATESVMNETVIESATESKPKLFGSK